MLLSYKRLNTTNKILSNNYRLKDLQYLETKNFSLKHNLQENIMKLHSLNKCQSLYLAGVFTTLPNLVFAGVFGFEVTIISLGIIACCGNCLGTYPGSTMDDSGIAHCAVTLLSILSLTDVRL